LIILLINILAMPAYLLMALLLGLGFVVSWLVNGYLVGREYMEMVAMRRLTPKDAKAFRKANGGSTFVAGFVIAVIMSVPFLNLLSPVLATAFMTHVFEDLRQRPQPAI
jgi:CysZ protein